MSGLKLSFMPGIVTTTIRIHGIDKYGVEREEEMTIPLDAFKEVTSQHAYSKLTPKTEKRTRRKCRAAFRRRKRGLA